MTTLFFFHIGDFRLKRTAFSRRYLEELGPPADPKKRPIGFIHE